MRISRLWSIANWLKALAPKSPTLRASGKPRLTVQQRLRLVRPGEAIAAESTGATGAPHPEAPGQGPRVVVRVLIVHEDARIRDVYRWILLETDVNHDIAAFRELRARTKSFEVICCAPAEEAVALAQEAAAQQRPFAIAFIGVQGSGCSGMWAAAGIRKADGAAEIVLCTAGSAIDPLEFGGLVHRKTNCLICRAIPRRARCGR